ncbi:serine/threonine protein phosphatase [archaeon]|nr:MAG: serine/threonine protein phosphatase [archaeon]
MSTLGPPSTPKVDVNSIVLPVPSIPHKELQREDLKDRMIVVGDIHGCLEEFKELLVKAEFEPSTTSVLLLGDLVNKGLYSDEVVQYARAINAFCIRGNHDDYALKYALGLVPSPIPEHLSYLSRLSPEDIAWLRDLPYTITIPSWKIICVHAGLVPGKALEEQSYIDITLMRNLLTDDSGRLTPTSSGSIGEPWVSKWQGNGEGWTVLFGHDAKRMLQRGENYWGLDTGCSYGKMLSALVLPRQQLVQVKAKQVYQEIVDK